MEVLLGSVFWGQHFMCQSPSFAVALRMLADLILGDDNETIHVDRDTMEEQ